jgi:hypothetical protein
MLTLKGRSCHRGKIAKERITVLLCVNSDGSDKQVPIVVGKSMKPCCLKKKLPVKFYANKKVWMPPWVCKVETFYCLWTIVPLIRKICHF